MDERSRGRLGPAVGQSALAMDPSRKRFIRLTVALTAALLLASALVYTSFSAGRDELTAGQLLKRAQPGQSYILAGTVLDGSVRHAGSALLFRVRDPKLKLSVPVRYTASCRTRSGGPRGSRDRSGARVELRRRAGFADHEVPVQVPGRGRLLLMPSMPTGVR